TGEYIQAEGELRRPEEARNPGAFDAAAYYRRRGICFQVFADRCMVVEECPRGIDGFCFRLKESLFRLRSSWKELLLQAAGEKNGGVLAAILLGDKSSLDEAEKELYMKAGIGHILAISGLHISFLGMGVYRMLRKAGVSCEGAGMIGMTVLGFYLLMLGPAVSILRAMIMLAFRIGADLAGRTYDPATALSVSGFLIALWNPYLVIEAGFLFSFGAIFAILWLVPVLQELYQGEKHRKKLWDALAGSVGIQLVLLPFTRWFYYEIPVYAVFLNLLVIPLLTVLMTAAMLGSVVYLFLPAAGEVCMVLAGGILKLYHVVCTGSLALPFARLITGKPSIWQAAGYLLCLVMIRRKFKISSGGKQQNARVRGEKRRGGFMLLLLVVCGSITIRLPGRLGIVMLDVGQGDGIYLQGPSGKSYLIDGGSSDIRQLGKYRLEPFLKQRGTGRVDYVFLSHGDGDHISGIAELLERKQIGVRIRNLMLPAGWQQEEALAELARKAAAAGTRVCTMTPGSQIRESSMKISCLGPQVTEGRGSNENSMILSLEYGAFSMLFTGDTEGKGETELIRFLEEQRRQGKDTEYTVLKTAHHGAAGSTPTAFLEQVRPTAALISVGIENSYGHPHPDTLKRLQQVGCRIYRTDEGGAIQITSNGKKSRIKTFLQK
ncbi:MAG TPA: DNA internalization-related competence protein ComEC/Rec2, partial [Lachnospiraceae bacterium]|nr:DNA internalization-related competence protein ComEC/Rec2 [Lachnospiraceae bacterium]